jgi:hypothetical protein
MLEVEELRRAQSVSRKVSERGESWASRTIGAQFPQRYDPIYEMTMADRQIGYGLHPKGAPQGVLQRTPRTENLLSTQTVSRLNRWILRQHPMIDFHRFHS